MMRINKWDCLQWRWINGLLDSFIVSILSHCFHSDSSHSLSTLHLLHPISSHSPPTLSFMHGNPPHTQITTPFPIPCYPNSELKRKLRSEKHAEDPNPSKEEKQQKSPRFWEEHSRRFAPSLLIISIEMSESNVKDTEKNQIPEDDVDKKKIYATEKKIFVDWIKAVCGKCAVVC